MKLFLIAASLFLSSVSFANPLQKFLTSSAVSTFNGEGTWRMADGSSDKWTALLTIETLTSIAEKEAVKLTWNLQIHNPDSIQSMDFSLQFVFDGDSRFFQVMSEDGTTALGRGYCDEKVCHFQKEDPATGADLEETWSILDSEDGDAGHIDVVGSQSFNAVTTDIVYRGKYTPATK